MYKHLTSCTNQNRIDRTKKENLEDEQNYNSSIYNISDVYVEPAFDRSQCMASMYVKHTSMRHIALIVLYCACASAISSHSFTITTALFTFPASIIRAFIYPRIRKQQQNMPIYIRKKTYIQRLWTRKMIRYRSDCDRSPGSQKPKTQLLFHPLRTLTHNLSLCDRRPWLCLYCICDDALIIRCLCGRVHLCLYMLTAYTHPIHMYIFKLTQPDSWYVLLRCVR